MKSLAPRSASLLRNLLSKRLEQKLPPNLQVNGATVLSPKSPSLQGLFSSAANILWHSAKDSSHGPLALPTRSEALVGAWGSRCAAAFRPSFSPNYVPLATRGVQTSPPPGPTSFPVASPGKRRPVVAVGMSGGVDSAVSALLLQRAGYEVVGLFMRNWDAQEEDDAGQCSADQDLKDAKQACAHLGIPLHEVDFVRRYWTDVFEQFVAECARGLTPNPDLPCNRHIKFDALLHHALAQGADLLATGHYARLDSEGEGGARRLLRGKDPTKDQSYFLAQVESAPLERVLFPVGGSLKSEVRQLATDAGLLVANKRSSRGICFLGKRRFERFIAQYVPLQPGPFVNVGDGRPVGTHGGLAAYTNGQRARIGGSALPWFVVGKSVGDNAVFVARGEDHPALYSDTALVAPLFWVTGRPPRELLDGREMVCSYKARYVQRMGECTVRLVEGRAGMRSCRGFEKSSFSRVDIPELAEKEGAVHKRLLVRFKESERALTPRQALVLYDGDVCLGGGLLAHPGRTKYEMGESKEVDVLEQAAA